MIANAPRTQDRRAVRAAFYGGVVLVFSTATTTGECTWWDIPHEPEANDIFDTDYMSMRERCRASNLSRARARYPQTAPRERVGDGVAIERVVMARAPRRGPHRSRALLGRAHPLNRNRRS